MSETPIEQTATTILLSPENDNLVSDNDCSVSLVHGRQLDSRRARFETALLSLNATRAERPTLVLPLKTAGLSLMIQSLRETNDVAVPRSLAVTAGLIAHGYVPDDWLCGLMTLASVAGESACFTAFLITFDAQIIYGRSLLEPVNISNESATGHQAPRLSLERLNRARPLSVKPQRQFEVLYVARQPSELDKSRFTDALRELSETLEILVEPLPAPTDDLCSAGIRWLSAEVC